jgi:hypothetical protein
VTAPSPEDPVRPRTRRILTLSLLGLFPLGCGDDPPPPPPAEPLVASAPIEEDGATRDNEEMRARAAETAALITWLREQRVTEARFCEPRVLYTWTQPSQIEELRVDRPTLLSRSRGSAGQMSGFDHALVGDPSPLARHLRSPNWSARRFAWPHAWATRRGWASADYGDRLVRVELRDNAWIARFDPDGTSGVRWDVRDVHGEAISEREVRAEPWRVGAVYHSGRGPALDGTERAFREYVIVSEVMVARFSVADDATERSLARDRAQLAVLADRLSALNEPVPALSEWPRRLHARWRDDAAADIVALYEASLALGSEHYTPTAAHAREIAAALVIPSEEPLAYTVPPMVVRRPIAIAPVPPAYTNTYPGPW